VNCNQSYLGENECVFQYPSQITSTKPNDRYVDSRCGASYSETKVCAIAETEPCQTSSISRSIGVGEFGVTSGSGSGWESTESSDS
jgi:hypothetical protein